VAFDADESVVGGAHVVDAAKHGLGVAPLPCFLGDAEPDLVRVTAPLESLTRKLWAILVMATALFVGSQRKLAARPPNRSAARWLVASRAAALSLLAL